MKQSSSSENNANKVRFQCAPIVCANQDWYGGEDEWRNLLSWASEVLSVDEGKTTTWHRGIKAKVRKH